MIIHLTTTRGPVPRSLYWVFVARDSEAVTLLSKLVPASAAWDGCEVRVADTEAVTLAANLRERGIRFAL